MDYQQQAQINRTNRRQANADRPRRSAQIATIGPRANNGRYDLTLPDGGVLPGKGVKIFNARHDEGQVVQSLPRRDGAVLLEGPKAINQADSNSPLSLPALVDRCDGYLKGQIFNCGVPGERETTSIWAIGISSTNFDTFYQLINLTAGTVYTLAAVPNTIRPCPINNDPPTPPEPPPPTDPEGQWFEHRWVDATWETFDSEYGIGPAPPDSILSFSSNVTFTLIDPQGIYWLFRIETGAWTQPGGFVRNTLTRYTQGEAPPALISGSFYIVSGQGQAGSAFTIDPGTYAYRPLEDPTIDNQPEPPAPPRDTNPNNPDIPNDTEYSLSIDANGEPIAHIRHTKNCIFDTWAFDKSFRIVNNAVQSYQGRLTTDWRYGTTFDCRDQWVGDKFANLLANKIWQIPVDDRPGTLASNTPTNSKIQAGTLNPSNCGTPVLGKLKTLSIRQNGNIPLTIGAIAAQIKTRKT